MSTYGTSSENIIFKESRSLKFRTLVGVNGVLVLAVLGLIIALIVVSVNQRSDSENSSEDHRKILAPDCPANPGSDTPELDRANCVLETYPLIDG